ALALLLPLVLEPAALPVTEPLRPRAGTIQSSIRVTIHAGGHILPQQLIRHVTFPAGGQWTSEVTRHGSVQEHARRIDISLTADRAPGEDLRGRVQPCARTGRLVRLGYLCEA